jgi:hypothetical protein
MLAGLGFGLSLGGGVVYALATNLAALVVFVALVMFIIGAALAMFFALALNRQWTGAVFGQPQMQPRISNNYRLPAYPPYQTPQPQQYLPEPGPQFEIIEPGASFTDDKPVA